MPIRSTIEIAAIAAVALVMSAPAAGAREADLRGPAAPAASLTETQADTRVPSESGAARPAPEVPGMRRTPLVAVVNSELPPEQVPIDGGSPLPIVLVLAGGFLAAAAATAPIRVTRRRRATRAIAG